MLIPSYFIPHSTVLFNFFMANKVPSNTWLNSHAQLCSISNDVFKRIDKARLLLADYFEPRLADYFARIDSPLGEPPEQVEQLSTYDARSFEAGAKVQAEFIIQMKNLNKSHVIDFTFVEPTSQTFTRTLRLVKRHSKDESRS